MLCKKCGSLLLARFVIPNFINSTPNLAKENFSKKKTDKKRFSITSNDPLSMQKAAAKLTNKQRYRNNYFSSMKEEKIHTRTTQRENQRWFLDYEHNNALKLKKKLMKKFEKNTLEQAIPGKIASNVQGKCYIIDQICESNFKKMDYKNCKKILLTDFKILLGIGPKREHHLKKNGYTSIEDLKNHPIWNKQASNFMSLVDKKRIGSLQSYLWKKLPKSHPLIHYLAGLSNSKDFTIVDIETLGLSERPIILLGIAKIKKNDVHTSQFLLRDISDEPSAIWGFISKIRKNCSLISYNGRSFDIPYIQQRLAYYGIEATINNPHFDLLHFTRRALRHKLRNCRLETVEEYLNIERGINIPGGLVPDFYQTYLKTGNVGPLVAIVEHNKQDLVTLATLFSRLYEEWNI